MHTHTHTHTYIRQELTEWHLNMLPWHRACRHGNSIRGEKWAMGCTAGISLYTFSFLSVSLSDRQVAEGGWSLQSHTHTHTHTPSCSSTVFGLRDFRQPVFQSVPSYQHPLVPLLQTYNPSMSCCCRDAELKLHSANKRHKHSSARKSQKK